MCFPPRDTVFTKQQTGVAFGAVGKKSWLRYHTLELKLHCFSTFGAHIWHRSLQGVKVKVVTVRWIHLSPVITVQLWYFRPRATPGTLNQAGELCVCLCMSVSVSVSVCVSVSAF